LDGATGRVAPLRACDLRRFFTTYVERGLATNRRSCGSFDMIASHCPQDNGNLHLQSAFRRPIGAADYRSLAEPAQDRSNTRSKG
jgi:hypothetical protein